MPYLDRAGIRFCYQLAGDPGDHPPLLLSHGFGASSTMWRPNVAALAADRQVITIDTRYVTGELVDYLSRDDMAQVEHGLSRYLGLLRRHRSRPRGCQSARHSVVVSAVIRGFLVTLEPSPGAHGSLPSGSGPPGTVASLEQV
jgi:hypothetical protein